MSQTRADRVTTHPYLCTTCGQTFRNGRALGGHQNAHRLERSSSAPHARRQASPVNAQSNWVHRAMLAQLQFHRSHLLGSTGNFAPTQDMQALPSLMQGAIAAQTPYDRSHNSHFNLPQDVHSPPNLTETPTPTPQPYCQNHLESHPSLIERPTLAQPSHNPNNPMSPSHFAPRVNLTMDTKGKGIVYERPHHQLRSGLAGNSSPTFPFNGPRHEEEMAGEFHPGVNLPLPLSCLNRGVVSLTTAGNAAIANPVQSYMLGATVKDLLPLQCVSIAAGSDLPPLLGRNDGDGVTLNLLEALGSHPMASSATPPSLDLNLHL